MSKHKSPDWDDEEPKQGKAQGSVRVRCISSLYPWTDVKRLAFGEEADVPREVADTMIASGFVERVE